MDIFNGGMSMFIKFEQMLREVSAFLPLGTDVVVISSALRLFCFT